MVNVLDNVQEDPPEEYQNLAEVIDLEGFKYDESYREQGKTLLQPRMEKAGYTFIEWFEGERDCFGPLTRTCRAFDPYGRVVWFFYG